MLNLHKEYITEILDDHGHTKDFSLHCEENFNFAYDVIDRLGEETPDRRAMRWCDDKGGKEDFTFAERTLQEKLPPRSTKRVSREPSRIYVFSLTLR